MDIEKFLSEYRKIESEDTRKAYRGYLSRYQAFLDELGIRIDDVQVCHIDQFAKRIKGLPNFRTKTSGVSDSTVKSHLAAVRSLHTWHNHHYGGLRNPGQEYKYRRTQPPRTIFPVETGLANDMCRCSSSKRDVAMVRLFRGSGVRLGELVAMNKASIEVDLGADGKSPCGIARVFGKGKKWRTVLVSEIALHAIADYLDERGEDDQSALFLSSRRRRISRRTVQRVIHSMAVNAGGDHVHPHQFRHCFGTEMIDAGLPEDDLQKRLGHEYLDTTYDYAEISEANAILQYELAMQKNEEKAATLGSHHSRYRVEGAA